MAQKGLGHKRDAGCYLTPWAFSRLAHQGKISIWHGEEDFILPHAMAKRMHEAAPRSNFRLVAGEGHYSLSINALGEILSAR
jgi:pimeloyl-ACP methyl ester carboxylesterase